MRVSNSTRTIGSLGLAVAFCMAASLIPSNGFAAQVTLAWDPNTEPDLAGYKIHYGTASGSYTTHVDVHNVTTYTVAGLTDGQTYYFAATAYNSAGNESGYSNSVSYTVPGAAPGATNGAPTAPSTPSGASSASVNTAITFSTSAADPNGDSLQYRYDWGNGVVGGWGVASQSHSWAGVGQYAVRAQARDSLGAESPWSNAKSVSIGYASASSAAPLRPTRPAGPDSAWVNVTAVFSTSATDPNGDSLQYRYDWGDGVVGGWGAASQSHGWGAAGQYAVRAQARDSLGAESAWSRAKTVTVQSATAGGIQLPDTDGDGVPDGQDAFPADQKEWADSNGNGIGDNAEAAAGQGERAPNAPLLTSPVTDSVVSPTVELKTGPFNSPVAGTTHATTRWQVFRDEDDVCVLDIQSAAALMSFTVPKLVLDEGTPFYWRAQFIDSNGTASAWSAYEYFSTETIEADRNANGVPDDQEVASTTDLDKDGVPDSQQDAIKSVKMEGTNLQTGISIKDTPTALAIEAVESEDARPPDVYAAGKPKIMPFGILNVKIAVAQPGDQAVVKLFFLEPAPADGKWYEYDTAAERWIDFSDYTEFAIDRMSATLTLRDGGPGDADGVANGIIIDPGGIGVAADGTTGGGAPQGGSGGGGGCFIGAVDDGGMNACMLGGLCLLLGFFCLEFAIRFFHP